jgi:hypothetical protein
MKRYISLFVPVLLFFMANASDCNITIALWKNFGRVSTGDAAKKDGCCSMQGVSCDKESVVKLNWSEQALVGTILPEIGQLKMLTSLILSANSISGSIPSEIGNLVKLENIDLTSNQLSGEIPSSIGQLTRLADLKLGANQLRGSLPQSLSNCKELRILWLGRNEFNGLIPSDLEQLTKLESLRLTANKFSTTISSCLINQMINLKQADLSNNPNLTGAVWSPSSGIELTVQNTNLTLCSSADGVQSQGCDTMRCIAPVNRKIPSWWILLLLVIVWGFIFWILGTYAYATYLERRLDDDQLSDTDESTFSDKTAMTKINGFKQDGRPNIDTIYSTRSHSMKAGTAGSAFSSFFAGGKYSDDTSSKVKSYKVVQPHTPANDDEIVLDLGEMVIVLEEFEDGWAFGRNQTKGESGVFPIVCLE